MTLENIRKKIAEDKNILRLLKDIEESMDEVNGEYGSKKRLCLYCGQKEYDSTQGIKHYPECPLSRLRNLIKVFEMEEDLRYKLAKVNGELQIYEELHKKIEEKIKNKKQ